LTARQTQTALRAALWSMLAKNRYVDQRCDNSCNNVSTDDRKINRQAGNKTGIMSCRNLQGDPWGRPEQFQLCPALSLSFSLR